jgi:hypothetical protein
VDYKHSRIKQYHKEGRALGERQVEIYRNWAIPASQERGDYRR